MTRRIKFHRYEIYVKRKLMKMLLRRSYALFFNGFLHVCVDRSSWKRSERRKCRRAEYVDPHQIL